jgi:hypothetical protein
MTAALDCPDLADWRLLLEDGLSSDQLERYERHLEQCPACQARLDQDAQCEEPLRQMVRRVGDPTAGPVDPTLSQFLERLHQDGAGERTTLAGQADLYFLTPTDRPDLLGTLGSYEVRKVIGQGGMGVVLLAYEAALQRLVAIKVLAAAVAGSATARKRFSREAQAAAAVCHDHVVTVHGVHESDGLPYLVMQYVPGESLQDRLDRTGPLAIDEIVRIGMQTASGLAAAHAQGLIHRDIKPANLLLENGLARVKITDFGLARMADDAGLTQNGVVAGTPEYMAPEQARGEPVDHRADLFSLGSVLYACCTGVPPFRGSSSAVAVLRKVSDEEPAPIRSLNPEIPDWLEAVIVRLLAKDPAGRFSSAAEVAALLEGYLAHRRQPLTIAAPNLPAFHGSPGLAKSDGRAGQVRWLRALLGWAALVLLVVMGVAWLLFPLARGVTANPAAGEPDVPVRRIRGHSGPVHNIRFTSDGRRLVSGSGWPESDQTVRVWDLESVKELGRIPVSGGVHSLVLTSDDRFALVGLNTGVVLRLDLETRRVVKTFQIHKAAVGCLVLAPDGKRVLSTSDEGTARLWNLADGKEQARSAASPLTLACPGCSKTLRVRSELAGKRVRCPQCGQAVAVPTIAVSRRSPG